MKKITSHKIAFELVDKMIETGAEIILWDEVDGNRIAQVVSNEDGYFLEVVLVDTVYGDQYHKYMDRADLEYLIWKNRKDVNRLNDLASM